MQTTRLYFTSKYIGPTDSASGKVKGSRYIVHDPYGNRHSVPYSYSGIPEIEAVLSVIGKINTRRTADGEASIKVISHDRHSIPGIKDHDIHIVDAVYEQ